MDKIPGFDTDVAGRPLIGPEPESLYAYGDLIRRTEQLILTQFGRGLVSGTTHTCLGQELCQMAVVRALVHPDDVVLSNHRNHGHFLTYSGEFTGLVAEVMGREAGVCGGHGGSQHLAYRHFHSNGVQGGMSGIGVGLGLARKLDDSESIVVVMLGDGTLGQGLLYESLNLASVWDIPILFVVENNGIAQTTDTSSTIGGSIEGRGKAFGLSTWRLDDADPLLFEQVEKVVEEVRHSNRPGFLIIDTRRLGPHSKGDDLRPESEKQAIIQRDPLTALGQRLPEQTRLAIEELNQTFIREVEAAATASPDACFADPPRHIFSCTDMEPEGTGNISSMGGQSENVRTHLNRALHHLLETSDKTIVLGEDLHDPYGGAFKVTEGLTSKFSGRVFSTPISEAGITGVSIGLSVAGYRPVMEVMFADFLTLCMDQLYNHAVKFPGVFRDVEVPLVIRAPSGGGRGYGPTHSQSPENIFTSVPGLTVVFGSHRHDVAGLLVNATNAWRYPVLFLEHKLLYAQNQDPGEFVPLDTDADDVATQLFPTLIRRRERPDITILTYGGMLPLVEKVAGYLEEEEELEVEIVVPALLSPLPRASLIAHLGGSPRLAIVEEAHDDFGVGAEILASLMEAGSGVRAIRIGTPPVPISSARSL
ncbi:MAG: thiamine pyrophosphate-dependent enzyme, partial [Gammaproteobacteria bacterium]|nr:thiamine pyrophosphate-dependent enzyme [Gammaproteobacteria bacterium]